MGQKQIMKTDIRLLKRQQVTLDGLIFCHGVVSSDTNELYTGGNSYWIASPSGRGADDMILMNSMGNVFSNSYGGTNGGFRPIICLKSNVELEKQQDGTYIIK